VQVAECIPNTDYQDKQILLQHIHDDHEKFQVFDRLFYLSRDSGAIAIEYPPVGYVPARPS
jgi:hypothetical protein